MKAALLGDEPPDEWDLPPKPNGMHWVTYERWVARYDAAKEMLDAQLVMAAARLMKRIWTRSISTRKLRQAAANASLTPQLAAQMRSSV